MGSVSSTAHVDAVGYKFIWLNERTTFLYPNGGTLSAPVKKESIISNEALSFLSTKQQPQMAKIASNNFKCFSTLPNSIFLITLNFMSTCRHYIILHIYHFHNRNTGLAFANALAILTTFSSHKKHKHCLFLHSFIWSLARILYFSEQFPHII